MDTLSPAVLSKMNAITLFVIFEEKDHLIRHLELISELLYYDYEGGMLEKAIVEGMLLEMQRRVTRERETRSH